MSYTIIVCLTLHDHNITHYDFVVHIATHNTHNDHVSRSKDHNYSQHLI